MNLPDYFIADLPSQTAIRPDLVTEACLTLKRNRAQFLAERTTEDLIEVVAALAEDWLDPENPFRRRALEQGPAATGFSRETLAAGLDDLFAALTAESLRALVAQDLGQLQRLERLSGTEREGGPSVLAMARGPELLAHITAGRLPNPVVMSVVLGLLAHAAQFVKCAAGTSFLPRLFGHSLHEIEPKLGACLEIAEWAGGTEALEAALFAQADCICATGTDATLAAIRPRVPAGARFLAYGSRASFGFIAQEALTPRLLHRTAAAAARDVAAWDQSGCLSPHAFYVETGGRNTPERFAEVLAGELAVLETRQPRGCLRPEAAAAIAARRAFYEVRAACSHDTRLWRSAGSTAWTVVYENDAQFTYSCLNRFVYVKAVAGLEPALRGAAPVMGRVSTVGLAATGARQTKLAHGLAAWGITRICPLGQMQRPPVTWRHDGRPSLGDLVLWTDWELADERSSV
jgi:hypothetical protein